MDLRQLKCFSAVARTGSFSRAAGQLGITQPTLSKHISNLESELGKRLLVRNGRGATVTEAGQRMADHAQRIMQMVSEAEVDIRSSGRGRFAIGIPFSIAATIGTELVAHLRKQDPGLNIAVIQGRSATLMERLFSGVLDVAILFKPPHSPLLETIPLVTEELFLMASKASAARLKAQVPIPIDQLATYPLMVPSHNNAVREITDKALRNLHQTPNFILEIDNIATILELVAKGEGYAVLSNLARRLSAYKDDVVPLRLARPGLFVEICIASSSRGSMSQANRQIVKLAAETSRKLLDKAVSECHVS
jgi:LysR family transcriptional regulator, nitrogen assimilation regulatory protein